MLHLCFKKIDKLAAWLSMHFKCADKSLKYSSVALHEAQLVELMLQMGCNKIVVCQHECSVLQMCFSSIAIYVFNHFLGFYDGDFIKIKNGKNTSLDKRRRTFQTSRIHHRPVDSFTKLSSDLWLIL